MSVRTVCPGFASLVGAGPGDPELLTWRAILRLRSADLVLYDGLVPKQLAKLAAAATHVSVAKRAGRKALTQAAISERMVAAAWRGQRVVRLKAGDPYVLGRGGEEAAALARAGVPFEVVPGVSSAIAAPALAGIPVTHRGLSSGFVVVSGHAEAAYSPVLGALPPDAVTVVILMGAVERSGIRRCLERAGWNAAHAGGHHHERVAARPARLDRHARDPRQFALRRPCRRRGSHRHRSRGIARDGHTLQPSVRLGGDIMAAIDDPKTLGRARLSFAKESDIDEFADMLGKFERGDITPDQWRGFRLLRGTYGQRQTDDSHMMRLKAPQGMLTADQLYALAAVAEEYSRGFGHITTRQNIQLHFVKLT